MKKFTFRFLTFMVIIALGVFTTGCDKDDDDDTPDGPPPTGTNITSSFDVEPGDVITLVGTFSDDLGLTELTLVSAEWALDKTIDLSDNPTSYDLSYDFSVPTDATPGAHGIVITANNTSEKSTSWDVTVNVAEPVSFDNIFAAGGFQWWAWNAEHAYYMSPDPNDEKWWEITVHVWDDYSEIKFLGQLEWNPDNWGLVDQANPSLGMINDENSAAILLDAMGKNPAYYNVRFNPYDMEWTADELVPDIPVQTEMYIVGKGFPQYPDLDWNPEQAIPMEANPEGWGEHLFVIYGLEFSEATDLKFIGQNTGWDPIDVGFDTDHFVDEDPGTDGYQVSQPINWIPTKSGGGTADLKFVDQAGFYTVLYDHYAQRAIIWNEE